MQLQQICTEIQTSGSEVKYKNAYNVDVTGYDVLTVNKSSAITGAYGGLEY